MWNGINAFVKTHNLIFRAEKFCLSRWRFIMRIFKYDYVKQQSIPRFGNSRTPTWWTDRGGETKDLVYLALLNYCKLEIFIVEVIVGIYRHLSSAPLLENCRLLSIETLVIKARLSWIRALSTTESGCRCGWSINETSVYLKLPVRDQCPSLKATYFSLLMLIHDAARLVCGISLIQPYREDTV